MQQDKTTPFDVTKVLSHVEKEITNPMAVPNTRPGRAIGVPDEVAQYAPPAVRALRNDSMLDTLAALLARLTYIDMMTFCRGILLDDAAEAVMLADKINTWAADNRKE